MEIKWIKTDGQRMLKMGNTLMGSVLPGTSDKDFAASFWNRGHTGIVIETFDSFNEHAAILWVEGKMATWYAEFCTTAAEAYRADHHQF